MTYHLFYIYNEINICNYINGKDKSLVIQMYPSNFTMFLLVFFETFRQFENFLNSLRPYILATKHLQINVYIIFPSITLYAEVSKTFDLATILFNLKNELVSIQLIKSQKYLKDYSIYFTTDSTLFST